MNFFTVFSRKTLTFGKNMIELYFVRHGQTEWNSIRKLQGVMDSPLTAEGVSQTTLLREAIDHITFDKCITSPLGRAYETALLLNDNSFPIEKNTMLTEMAFGRVEGMEKEHFKELYSKQFHNLWHSAHQYDPSDFSGEAFSSVVERAKAFLEEVKSEPDGSKVLIVSHGMMLKVIFGIIWNHSLEKFWDDPVPLNTSSTKVVFNNGSFDIIEFSNVSHLEDTEVISYV